MPRRASRVGTRGGASGQAEATAGVAETQATQTTDPALVDRRYQSDLGIRADDAGTRRSVPANMWWPVLILVLLDLRVSLEHTLNINSSDYDRRRATLATGSLIFRVHPLTIDALEQIRRHGHERLLPWPYDGGQEWREQRARLETELSALFRLPQGCS